MRRGHTPGRRIGIAVGLWAVSMASGCHQHYYVMNPSSGTFVPAPQAAVVGDAGGTIAYSDPCATPQTVAIGSTTPLNGPVVVSSSIPGTATSPPLLLGQPTAKNGWFGGGFRSWKPTPDPSRIAIQAEGAYNGEGAVVRQ